MRAVADRSDYAPGSGAPKTVANMGGGGDGVCVSRLVTSTVVGMVLASAGHILRLHDAGRRMWWTVAVVCGLLALRELGVLRFPLPMKRRQTCGGWFQRYGLVIASVLWGADIGLTFFTWIAFSGLWAIAVAVVTTGDIVFGAKLFACYWIGRATSTVTMPLILIGARDTSTVSLARSLEGQMPIHRHMQTIGLCGATAIAIMQGVR